MTVWTDKIVGVLPLNWADYRITWVHNDVDETDLHAFVKTGEASPSIKAVKDRIGPGFGLSDLMFRPDCPMDPINQDWWIWYRDEDDAEAARDHPEDIVFTADLVYVVGMLNVGGRQVFIGTENERS
jgi:hypothetical protein